MTRVTRGQY